jgi:hypothetical protein
LSQGVDIVVEQRSARRIVAAAALIAAVGLAAAYEIHLDAESEVDVDGLIQRVIAQTTRSGIAIQATREMRAGTVSGKHQAWMTVETTLASSGAFSWQVIEEGGSERTREKVFYEVLKNEAETSRMAGHDSSALTPDNYLFSAVAASRPGQATIRLTPRRSDPKLIDGILTVNADGAPVRLEGRMAKSPSFWVRSVSMVMHYGRFADIALPTSVETLADVRMVGRSSLTMRYRYTVVNGRTVSHAVASAPFVGPSAEILALHGSGQQQ